MVKVRETPEPRGRVGLALVVVVVVGTTFWFGFGYRPFLFVFCLFFSQSVILWSSSLKTNHPCTAFNAKHCQAGNLGLGLGEVGVGVETRDKISVAGNAA